MHLRILRWGCCSLCRFDTPLFYSDEQLQELAGTTLAAATAARKAGLTRSWQQLQPAVQQMLQQVGWVFVLGGSMPVFIDCVPAYGDLHASL